MSDTNTFDGSPEANILVNQRAPSTVGQFSNLDLAFNTALQRFINGSGGRITLDNAYRSEAEQKVLYDAKKLEVEAANPGWSQAEVLKETGKWVAPPGQSNHQRGLAADLNFGVKGSPEREQNMLWAHDNAAEFGLGFPLGNEDWHVQLDPEGEFGSGEGNGLGSNPGFNPELSEYAHLLTFLNHPTVGPILYDAAAQGLSPEDLQAQLMNTDWWQTTQDSVRKWEQLLATDPATAETRMDDTRQSIERNASVLGLTLDDNAISVMAETAQRMGWTDNELMEAITTKGEFDSGAPGGEIGATASDIQQLARRYLVVVTQSQASQLSLDIQNGKATLDSIQGNFALRAEAKFSGNKSLSGFIGNGGSPEDFFADHKNKIGQMIGVDPSSIDLINDPRYSQILSYVGDDGAVRPMTVHEAERLAREDTRFRDSRQGRSEAARLSTTFARAMGKAKF